MTVPMVARGLVVLALCASGLSAQSRRVGTAIAPDSRLITASAMGPVRLNMTLDEARRSLTGVRFARSSDGDGAALVDLTFGKDDWLSLWAAEDDPAAPIDWSRKIVTIEAFTPTFHTSEGVHPGSSVADVAKVFGPVREIEKSEIEGREFVTFDRQPRWLTFRLDYTGIFPSGTRRTTQFRPDARIWSIIISSL